MNLLYSLAADLLADLAKRSFDGVTEHIPAYSDKKLLEEVMLFIDWYLPESWSSIEMQRVESFADAWRLCLLAARSAPDVFGPQGLSCRQHILLPDRPA